MNQIYETWKKEPFPLKQTPETILDKIESIVKYLSQFYGFVGLESQEIQILFKFIFQYLQKYQRFKLCDIDRSIELFKKRPELNKLSPEYFETMFDKYRKSDERKLILKTWEEDITQHSNEISEKSKEYNANELLQICYENWKQSKVILLNTGLVYTKNFVLLESALGIEKMNELKEQTRLRLISEFEGTLAKLPLTNSNLADEAKRQLDLIKKGEGLLKTETRKAHLKLYFEMLEFETV